MIQKKLVKGLNMLISPLGAGVMRFQPESGSLSQEAFRLLDLAMERGINYFDTAFLYNSGRSEDFIRQSLVAKYSRGSFIIADKLPVWLCKNREDMERIFNIQLERLGVEYIDVYLLHALHKETWTQVYNHGVLDFLEEKKKEGRIRKAGFSFHDNADKLPMIADAYHWDLAQLQINYYDWFVHDVKQSYELLSQKDIPIVVMEPVGGGRLARLPAEIEKSFKAANPAASIPSWAIRFCASLPGVAVVLSGMTTETELDDNLSCFDPLMPLSEKEFATLKEAVKVLQHTGAIPCSACRYCTDECSAGIDIPHIFQQYNDYKTFDRTISLTWAYMELVPVSRRADQCVNCGRCVKLCPQKIDIPQQLSMVHEHALLLTLFGSNENFDEILDGLKGKTVVLFSAGAFGQSMLNYAEKRGLKVNYFCDNGSDLWGKKINGVEVISPEQLKKLHDTCEVKVLITNQNYFNAIKEQLQTMNITPVN